MARVSPGVTALNAGEFDSKLVGRVDIKKYAFAAARLENYAILPQGGITRRPGSLYASELKSSSNVARLIPFLFAVDDARMLEAGAGYIRIHGQDHNPITVPTVSATVTNGTFDTDISGWTDSSAGGSAISWDSTNQAMSFDVSGSDLAIADQEITNATPSTAHTLSVSIRGLPGTVVVLRVGTTQGGDEVIETDLVAGFHIVTFTPTTSTIWLRFQTNSDRLPGMDNVSFLSNQTLEIGNPYDDTEIDSLYTAQSADVIYMAVGTKPLYRLERQGDFDWSLVRPELDDGPYDILNTDGDRTLTPSATSGTVTITATGFTPFTAAWVGRLIRIRHSNTWGFALVTAFTSTTQVTAVVQRAFGNNSASSEWMFGAFSDASGFPEVVTFHEQRLALAATRLLPQSFWLSQSADFTNFRPDSDVSGNIQVEDDDALDFTISADQVNNIQWMSSGRELVIGTIGGEWTVRSSGSQLTPTDVDVKQQTTHGSSRFQPARVGHVVLYLQRSRRKIREFVFDFGTDAFLSPDLTQLAEQITRGGVSRLVYQQEPYNYIHALRNDGQIATIAYLRDENVVGWSRTIMGGSFGTGDAVVESMASLPASTVTGKRDQDELWLIVKRTINGQTRRYIEVLDRMFEGVDAEIFDEEDDFRTELLNLQKTAVNADSAIIYEGASTTTITGLDHLEGETVSVWSEGAIEASKTVSSGQITLEAETTSAVIGLPYQHVYKSMKVAYGADSGSSVGKVKRIDAVVFLIDNTGAIRSGPDIDRLEQHPLREVTDPMDSAVPLTTGEIRIPFPASHERDERVVIAGSDPAPHTILSYVLEMKTSGPV